MASVSDKKELTPFLLLAFLLALFFLILPHLLVTPVLDDHPGLRLPQPPALINKSLAQLKEVEEIQQKKVDFFSLLKPMVELENRYILQQRAWVQSLNFDQLTAAQQQDLLGLLESYGVSGKTDAESPASPAAFKALAQELLLRVDQVPLALVLVQAANESAWGRSRFAVQGNNLFGQWCFSRGCGLIPRQRPEGQYHEVAVFKTPQLSVRAYLKNLNSFWAYDDFRKARAARPELQGVQQALYLAEHLTRYSQRGQAYIQELKEMVQVNADLIEQAASLDLR